MSISGSLSEFSLPEIFRLLEQGNKSGRLSIHAQSNSLCDKEDALCNKENPSHFQFSYIWFNQGRIVAAADRLDGQGLLAAIQQRGWLSVRSASRIAEVCLVGQPTGLCLKSQGLLEAEQLKLLFGHQVLQQVSKLFELPDGKFRFEVNTPLPTSEMTGLSAPPREVTLASLRVLRDWTVFQDKLPEASSGMVSIVPGKPQLRLNQLEWQTWEFAGGNVAIREIAKHLKLPIEKIQQVVFRLMLVGVAEEVPMLVEAPTQQSDYKMPAMLGLEARANPSSMVSQSFLNSLVGVLQTKGKA